MPSAPRDNRFVNPRSGGGAAERSGVVDRARELGIEVVVLTPGQSLAALAQAAAEGGADALGMAGGDGSLAVVAAVAAVHDLPFVCIPAGTRNHFALDLGVDRQDLRGALDAFSDGVEPLIDIADVNGRPFLNNVSVGVYGDAVQRASYRDAKVRTLLETAQAVLGPSGRASAVAVTDDAGREHRQPRYCSSRTTHTRWTSRSLAAPARHSTPAGSGSWCSTLRAIGRIPRRGLDRGVPGGRRASGSARRNRRRSSRTERAAAIRHPASLAARPDLPPPPRSVPIGGDSGGGPAVESAPPPRSWLVTGRDSRPELPLHPGVIRLALGSCQEALDRGVARLAPPAGQIPEVQLVCFATNSMRRPHAVPRDVGARVVYLASAGKPMRLAPYRGFPRPGVVVGDQIATDGLLARRLGYAFVHYRPPPGGIPARPRLMRQLGRLLRPVAFRPAGRSQP